MSGEGVDASVSVLYRLTERDRRQSAVSSVLNTFLIKRNLIDVMIVSVVSAVRLRRAVVVFLVANLMEQIPKFPRKHKVNQRVGRRVQVDQKIAQIADKPHGLRRTLDQ